VRTRNRSLIQKGVIRPVRAAPSLAQRTGGTRHAGCKTLRFRRRYGKLRTLHHPQFTQGYDQVLAQPSHALAWYRYRRLLVPRDHHGQGVVVNNSLEFVSSHARFLYSQASGAASAATEPPQKASSDVSWSDALQGFGFGLAFTPMTVLALRGR
jgi:hypothetical protein